MNNTVTLHSMDKKKNLIKNSLKKGMRKLPESKAINPTGLPLPPQKKPKLLEKRLNSFTYCFSTLH